MSNIRRILCAVDFSDTSLHAVEHAAAIAGWYRASLTVLHVYAPMFMPVPGIPSPDERVAPAELQRVREWTATMVRSVVPPAVDVDVAVEVGPVADQILDHASLAADLLVIGTHGASGFERLILGSVAEKVLRQATCPVLTVPPRAHATSTLPFARVLCAVDFSAWSAAAFELAASLAAESGAALSLLHVIEWPWEEPPPPAFADLPPEQASALLEFRRYLVKSATSRLESMVTGDVQDRCAVTIAIAHGKAYAGILQVAADDEADLIVLGVHGRNPIDLALFGSTTYQVVRRATCPVLTLRK